MSFSHEILIPFLILNHNVCSNNTRKVPCTETALRGMIMLIMLACVQATKLLKQEMDVILKRCNGYHTFESEWREKWVPAILQYSGTLNKKEIKVLGAVPQEDDDGK